MFQREMKSVVLFSIFILLLALVIILAGALVFVITRGAGENEKGHRTCFNLYIITPLLLTESFYIINSSKKGIWTILSNLDAKLEKLEELLTHKHTHNHSLADLGMLSKRTLPHI